MFKYLILFLFVFLESDAMDRDFWGCVYRNESNPRRLCRELENLQNSGSAVAECFLDIYFPTEDGIVRYSSRAEEFKEATEAGKYLAQALYKRSAEFKWDDKRGVENLEWAQHFSKEEELGIREFSVTDEKEESTSFIRNRTRDMSQNRRNFIDAFDALEALLGAE